MMTELSDLTIVILGASGDLTRRLLFPALHRLLADHRLPANTRVVGYAIEDWTTEQFLDHLRAGVDQFGDGVDGAAWASIAAGSTYVRGDLTDASMALLKPLVGGAALFYLALPPALFAPAATVLATAGLADQTSGWRRLIVEKPFGTDVASARALHDNLLGGWQESQILRIDHFLGKDTVQNMLVFRLANRFIEAIWNRANILQVQITASESLGLEGRWRYYDKAGALRDMLQNHLMQLFALAAMEPPSVWEAEVLREHKVEVLRAVRPTDRASAVRGRYTAGTIDGTAVPGYLQEEGVPATSTTETYAALRLWVDNWRWQGVPFLLRSGKRQAGDLTEIALQLQSPPSALFASGGATVAPEPAWIVLRLRPDETIEIDAIAKKAGLGFATESIRLTATDTAVSEGEYSAYEQLLIDAVAGDASLFVRGDEALEAWRIVQPILDAWATGAPLDYPAGSDGPEPPAGFLPEGSSWRAISR